MVKKKRGLFLVLIMMLVLSMGLALLVACDDGNDKKTTTDGQEYTVTFKIRENGTGDWKVYDTVKSSTEGKVELPKEPSVEGFSFRGWFLDEACSSGKEFDANKVTADVTVYGHLSDKVLTVKVKKSTSVTDEKAEQTVANLAELKDTYIADALANELTFDGWYTNEACTTPYNAESGATEIFGRYVATVNFVDGYAPSIEYKQLVVPGEKMADIDESKVKASYMDSIYGYAKVDANGKPLERDANGAAKAIEKNAVINGNTTLSILWASKGLEYKNIGGKIVITGVAKDESTKDSVQMGIKVMRFPEYIKDGEELLPVETVAMPEVLFQSIPTTEKIIFADGIKTISGFNSMPGMGSVLTDIVLPDTLKIIDTAFWGLEAMKSFNIPDGVEVIIDSLWGAMMGGMSENNLVAYNMNPEYGFDINIPSSVKHLSMVPANFKFAEGSPFFYENGSLYKKGADNNYETLVYTKGVGSEFNVKDGVKFIQVGALSKCANPKGVVNITIPASFESVAYNPKNSEYPYYVGGILDNGMASGNVDIVNRLYYDGELTDGQVPEGKETSPKGKSIVSGLDGITRVAFNSANIPAEFPVDAIIGDNGNYNNQTYINADKVVATGTITDGETVNVVIHAYEKGKLVQNVSLENIKSNQTAIKAADIANALNISLELYELKSVKNLGVDFFAVNEAEGGKMITSNAYLTVDYARLPGGATIVNGAVTGFDLAKATPNPKTGKVLVTIPDFADKEKQVPVTTINANAFTSEEAIANIEEIVIGSKVTEIGDNAFKGLKFLKNVTFGANSELAVIGAHAFEDTAITSIALPLKKLTNVKPYAFRTPTLEEFIPVEGENHVLEDMTQDNSSLYGKYVIIPFGDNKQINAALYKLNNITVEDLPKDHPYAPYGMKKTTVYADLVAIAGGFKYGQFVLGADVMGMEIHKINVLEGSVYYLQGLCDNSMNGAYGLVMTKHIQKVHENAFTRITEDLLVAKGSDGQPNGKSNLKVPKGYGLEAGNEPALTTEALKTFFKGTAFQGDDTSLVKWFNGKVFGDKEIEALDPKAVEFSAMNIS